ncbi:MAG TPA: nitroreductase family protein [Acidimicrobiales bacterium]|nr:nitroreductase family protein [Acidimicrobiales bacterium]
MSELLDLDPDQLLSTTRAVRKRLDLERPLDLALVRECIELASQAPTGSNAQGWHFVVVTDPATRKTLAEYYREGFQLFYGDREAALAGMPQDDADYLATQRRVVDSAAYLAEHMEQVPVHVIPCVEGRFEQGPVMLQAAIWGSLLPAAWSFCLAARARGLGTCWTTLHLIREREAAELLGLPDNIAQGALIPVAHTIGTDFKPGPRRDLDRVIHLDGW